MRKSVCVCVALRWFCILSAERPFQPRWSWSLSPPSAAFARLHLRRLQLSQGKTRSAAKFEVVPLSVGDALVRSLCSVKDTQEVRLWILDVKRRWRWHHVAGASVHVQHLRAPWRAQLVFGDLFWVRKNRLFCCLQRAFSVCVKGVGLTGWRSEAWFSGEAQLWGGSVTQKHPTLNGFALTNERSQSTKQ